MELTREIHGNALVIRAEGARIDAAGAIGFKDGMRDATDNAGPTPTARVILDLSQVAFLDSSGLGAVVAVMKMLAPARRLELAAPTPAVAKVFRLTRMDTVFAIHDRVEDAINHAG